MKKNLSIVLYSAVTGLLLAIFSFIPNYSSYIFSIAAFFVGLKFFRTYDSIKLRIIYAVISILFMILFMAVFIVISYQPV